MRSWVVAVFALMATALPPSVEASSAPSSVGLRYYENPQTLSGVAHRFHLSVRELAALNGIKDPNHFDAHGLLLPDTSSTRSLPRYVPWTAAPPRTVCNTNPLRFHAVKRKGCSNAAVATGPAGEQATLCSATPDKDWVEMRVDLRWRPGQSARIQIPFSIFNLRDRSRVDIASIDLDGDAEPELLVSYLTAVSNGIAQEFRTLIVFKDGRELVRYDSGEFTAETAAVLVGERCHLASSHYEQVTHPLRGPALYLVERAFDPLTMSMDESLVGSRFSDGVRFVLPFDPLAPRAKKLAPQQTVLRFRRQPNDELLVGLHDAAKTRWARMDGTWRFGDGATGRVYPIDFVWNGLAGRSGQFRPALDDYWQVFWLAAPLK